MQIAIRRVLPTARQQLARPQRLGLPVTTHLRIRAHTRFFSQTHAALRTNDDATSIPIELTEGVERDVEAAAASPEVAPGTYAEGGTAANDTTIQTQSLAGEVSNVVLAAAGGADGNGDPTTRPPGRPLGSKGRRPSIAKGKPVPRPNIPDWFTERNVMLRNDIKATDIVVATGDVYIMRADEKLPPAIDVSTPAQAETVKAVQDTPAESAPVEPEVVQAEEVKPPTEKAPKKRTKKAAAEEPTAVAIESAASEAAPVTEKLSDVEDTAPAADPLTAEAEAATYQIYESVWREITANVRTGLILPKAPHMDSLAANKAHSILHVPRKGGVYYLDSLVNKLALEMGADLVRIDAQDVAEIAGDYLGDTQTGMSNLKLDPIDSYQSAASESDLSSVGIRALGYDTQISEPYQGEEGEKEETYEEDTEKDDTMDEATSQPNPADIARFLPPNLQQLFRGSGTAGKAVIQISPFRMTSKPLPEKVNEKKMDTLLKYLIGAAHAKRLKVTGPSAESASDAPTLIHVRDYRELDTTVAGHALLKNLHDIVQKMRREGERILIVGTSSQEEPIDSYGEDGIKLMQYQSEDANERTIVVPPFREAAVDVKFEEDRTARIREINIRHLRDVIRRRSGVNADSAAFVVSDNWHIEQAASADEILPGISDEVWSFDRVHRIATIALGERPASTHELSVENVGHAVKLLTRSDDLKTTWVGEERKVREANESAIITTSSSKPKEYTKHEKKFLSRVVNPADINTTFASVRAPAETIESMQILTSMSLIRPEAFKYGVLSTDRIPGVLLYGPPGTGKTLLARAVAKESGATVLEISGADIEDMYVGESEKNVKAVFSLAKKLSPCVLFIDEADAIFNSRQDSSARSNRRETINQFLKEWADMSGTAFIMLATNRPFDLDDAVLRRLPRRILIDLPTAEDRLAILQIHLANETLAPDVDLKHMADTTQLYSGSDLKNVCVSAALACVRDENAEFKKTGTYPERRTLLKKNFEKALKEVTPSISDDMKSLAQIRTFDEKYGERAGKKKPKSTWGFEQGQGNVTVKRSEGRVRME